MLSWFGDLMTLASVVVIDVALAGDNALVVGLVAAGVPPESRVRVIVAGVAIACLCRIAFALVAMELLAVVGLLFAGGLLLLWVAWKMWREMPSVPVVVSASGETVEAPAYRSPAAAIFQIGIADVSMSLDNVLAVAGTARHNGWILAFGLVLSVALMGLAAGLVSRLLIRYPWFNLLGIAIVAVVALIMIFEGGQQIADMI
jgi:YjbE family integral membrane protein